jgi:hypothetical protein
MEGEIVNQFPLALGGDSLEHPEPVMNPLLVQALDENTLTVEQLHAMIKAVLSNADCRKNAQAMQQHVRNAGGYKRAADAIMNFAQSQRQATTQA